MARPKKSTREKVYGSNNPYSLIGKPKFDDGHKRRLRQHGLDDEQIERLQEQLGPIVLAHRAGPTKTQVLDALQRMEKSLREVEDAFNAVQNLIDDDGLGLKLRKLLDAEYRDDRDFGEDLELLLEQVIRIRFTVGPALTRAKRAGQARLRSANSWPIALIDRAIQPHNYSLTGDAFTDICKIAVEAATGKEVDPRKAILAYSKALKDVPAGA